jgi:hypothetical protein
MKHLTLFLIGSVSSLAASWIREQPKPGDFPLFHDGVAAEIFFSTEDFKVVSLAAHDLQEDVARVTGITCILTVSMPMLFLENQSSSGLYLGRSSVELTSQMILCVPRTPSHHHT